jgi:hypothetical protein
MGRTYNEDRTRYRGRLAFVPSPIEETFWTAKEWAERTRVPYRTILTAAARGDLAAVRPSGSANGIVLISESSWVAWLEGTRIQIPSKGRVRSAGRTRDGRDLSDLALS